MDSPELSRYLKRAPTTPGVYTWRDKRGRPIYIGKAANLKSRLSSYQRTTYPRIHIMVEAAARLDWQETATDIEALITESQLIKRYRPKFNVDWRDDKQYFFVAITKEEFPQLILTHQHRSNKIKKPIAELIGPFTDGLPLKTTLRVLRGLFPYCSCKQKHFVKCLNAHIGNCPGYCCLREPPTKVEVRRYARNIKAIRDILTGKRDTLIRRMERRMEMLGHTHQLEGALALQRSVERVRRVFQNAQINTARRRTAAQHHGALAQARELFGLPEEPRRIEGYDVANIQGEHRVGAMVVFTDGHADNAEYRQFNVRVAAGGDTAMLAEMLERRLGHPEWPFPDLVLVDGGKAQLNAATKALANHGFDIPVVAMTKDDRHQADHIVSSLDSQVHPLKDLPRPVRDLLVHVDSEAHRFSIKQYRQKHRRSIVGV